MFVKKRGFLILEVAIVILLVTLTYVFLLRSYAGLSRTNKKINRYYDLISRSEEKIWDLRRMEQEKTLKQDIQTGGTFEINNCAWRLVWNETEYQKIYQTRIVIDWPEYESFDQIILSAFS